LIFSAVSCSLGTPVASTLGPFFRFLLGFSLDFDFVDVPAFEDSGFAFLSLTTTACSLGTPIVSTLGPFFRFLLGFSLDFVGVVPAFEDSGFVFLSFTTDSSSRSSSAFRFSLCLAFRFSRLAFRISAALC
jgi:hypothetical protein